MQGTSDVAPLTLMAKNAAAAASLRMVHLKTKVPTKSICAKHLEWRKEILTLLNLQKLLQNKEEDPSSTDYAEFQIALSVIKEGLSVDPLKYHKMGRCVFNEKLTV
uniref:SWR1-complex protein 4-like n=1 Tax=Tanacetum cinerariifolium TaxID=118510 RepID=A0A699J4Y8_TANCI|nr:SWR1-complex protein 4-like [Tanacetum cinerariifolium]